MVLIDLTPEALIARLRAGKIYPGENIDAALNNFFRIENLAALREVSLRQVAEDVESKRLTLQRGRAARHPREERVAAEVPKAVGERLLALVRPAAQLAAPGAARLALGAAARHRPRPALGEAAGQADRGRGRAPGDGAAPARLGARRDPADRGARRPRRRRRRGSSRERGTTYIMVGESPPPRGLARLREPLPQRLMRATPPGVDVRIVAHRGAARRGES